MDKKINTVWALVNDLASKKGITEIVINGPKTVFVERGGQFTQLNVSLTKTDMYEFINEVASYNKKVCDTSFPIFDGSMPDGSRINAIIEPFSSGAPAISIRKYLQSIQSFDQDHDIFGLNSEWVDFFKSLVSAKMNIVVSGGSGVGKTTFLNLLLAELDPVERVITIEDTLELNIKVPNKVRLEVRGSGDLGQPSLGARDLVKNTLRMRPDRLIIGEVRGGEAFDLMQAMNTGHDGSMTSIHSNAPTECLSRIETLYLLAGFEVPYHVIRKQISTAIDFIIQVSRNREGLRVVSHVQELTGMEGDIILSQSVAELKDDKLALSGPSPKNMEKLHGMGGLRMDFFAGS